MLRAQSPAACTSVRSALFLQQAPCYTQVSTSASVQAQLEGEPFHNAPRVPPAETPGIRRAQAEAPADPSSPTAHAHQLDAFVDSFIDHLISDVRAELTAAIVPHEVTAPPVPDSSASNAAEALHAEQPHQADALAHNKSANLQPAARSNSCY